MPRKLLAEAPVILMAYDLLEHDGRDIRHLPFADRRAALAGLVERVSTRAPLRL